jgi:hypothetical protein
MVSYDTTNSGSLMNSKDKISHVTFDIFGTLIKFGVQHHPFRQLLKWARENCRQVLHDDARTVMTINGGVDAISYGLGIKPPRELVQKVESQIEDELSFLTPAFSCIFLCMFDMLAECAYRRLPSKINISSAHSDSLSSWSKVAKYFAAKIFLVTV